jgi:uncharacterized protein (DUF1800 family)
MQGEAVASRRRRRGKKRTGHHRRRHSALPVYRGHFGTAQAERLLWRAGFGPRPGDVKKLAKKGLNEAVLSLTHPPKERLTGPLPKNDEGRSLDPFNIYNHDSLWWLDKMVRTNRPLIERMTLSWHDWFATNDDEIGSPRLMIGQNNTFRRRALGSFKELLLDITKDPAMLVFLSGSNSDKDAPNENYAREMMELFTIGVGRGYTENDVREQARALTGFTNDWDENLGLVNFHFDPERHDGGVKKVFGHSGRFDWQDACRLTLEHPSHPSFFVQKLWSYFIPTAPPHRTQKALERLYLKNDYAIRPVVEAILHHPALYRGPRMVKPPIVYLVGLLRGMKRGIDTEEWNWVSYLAGQRLFFPPDVSGWQEDQWLDTSTWRGRWFIAMRASETKMLDTDKDTADPDESAAVGVDRALAFWGNPGISRATRSALERFAERCVKQTPTRRKDESVLLRQNALRMMVATSPDLQTS